MAKRLPVVLSTFGVCLILLAFTNLANLLSLAASEGPRPSGTTRGTADLSRTRTAASLPPADHDAASHSEPVVLAVLGTRPEVIKLAPVVWELRKRCAGASVGGVLSPPVCRVLVVSTNQQAVMVKSALQSYGLWEGRVDLREPRSYNEGHSKVAAHVLEEMGRVIRQYRPSLVIAQGDTTTAMMAAVAAFYEGVPVAHVEAGLRTGDLQNPFPEEFNRKVVALTAAFHFAPTERSRQALLKEGVREERIWVTGNTVVDALFDRLRNTRPSAAVSKLLEKVADTCDECVGRPRLVLVTMHRRESWGKKMEDMCEAILAIVKAVPDAVVVLPVHTNPAVADVVKKHLDGRHQRIVLTPPMSQDDFPFVLNASTIVITDSGGVQEEGVSLGKPILVMRETTERPEGVIAGNSVVVGRDPQKIRTTAIGVLNNEGGSFDRMSVPHFPYGTGNASVLIGSVLVKYLAPASALAGGALPAPKCVSKTMREDPVDPATCLPRPERHSVALSLLVGKSHEGLNQLMESLERSDLSGHDAILFAWVNDPESEAEKFLRLRKSKIPVIFLGVGRDEGFTVPRFRIFEEVQRHSLTMTRRFDVLIELEQNMLFPRLWFDEILAHRQPSSVGIIYPVVVQQLPSGSTYSDLEAFIAEHTAWLRHASPRTGCMPVHPWVVDLAALAAHNVSYYDPVFAPRDGADLDFVERVERSGLQTLLVQSSWAGYRDGTVPTAQAPRAWSQKHDALFSQRHRLTFSEWISAKSSRCVSLCTYDVPSCNFTAIP